MLCVKRDRLNLKDKSFILASCEFIFVDMKFYTHSYKNTLLFYFILLFFKTFSTNVSRVKKKALYQICIAAKQFLETVTTESFYAWSLWLIRPNMTVTNDKSTHFEREEWLWLVTIPDFIMCHQTKS